MDKNKMLLELSKREEAQRNRQEKLDVLIDAEKKRAVKQGVRNKRVAAKYESSLERMERLRDAKEGR